MELSFRLRQIADCVTTGNRVADIGTDHAFVPIYLMRRGCIPSAIAMDVGSGPLAHAVSHVRQYHYEDVIECRLSDGLEKLKPNEADSIIIAGMGGALMARILERGQAVLSGDKELILQPQSEYYKVRRKLHELSYRIVEERFFMDEGKYYNIMKAHFGDEHYDADVEYLFGKCLLEDKNPILREYLMLKSDKLNHIAQRIQMQQQLGEQTKARLKQIRVELTQLAEALHYYA